MRVVRVVFARADVEATLEVDAEAEGDAALSVADPMALDAELPAAGTIGFGAAAAEQPAIPRIPIAASAEHHPTSAKGATPGRVIDAHVPLGIIRKLVQSWQLDHGRPTARGRGPPNQNRQHRTSQLPILDRREGQDVLILPTAGSRVPLTRRPESQGSGFARFDAFGR